MRRQSLSRRKIPDLRMLLIRSKNTPRNGKGKEKTAEMQNEIDEIKKKAENELSLAKQKGETQILMAQNEAKRILENAKRAAASLMMELDRLKREQSNEKNASEMARKAKAALKQHLNTIDDMTYEKNDFDGDDDDYVCRDR